MERTVHIHWTLFVFNSVFNTSEHVMAAKSKSTAFLLISFSSIYPSSPFSVAGILIASKMCSHFHYMCSLVLPATSTISNIFAMPILIICMIYGCMNHAKNMFGTISKKKLISYPSMSARNQTVYSWCCWCCYNSSRCCNKQQQPDTFFTDVGAKTVPFSFPFWCICKHISFQDTTNDVSCVTECVEWKSETKITNR